MFKAFINKTLSFFINLKQQQKYLSQQMSIFNFLKNFHHKLHNYTNKWKDKYLSSSLEATQT